MRNRFILLFLTQLVILFCSAQENSLKKQVILSTRDLYQQGLIEKPYLLAEMEQQLGKDTLAWEQSVFCKAATLVANDLLGGFMVNPWFTFDAVSIQVHQKKLNEIRGSVLSMRRPVQLLSLISTLTSPRTAAEASLFTEYKRRLVIAANHLTRANNDTLLFVKQAYMLYKWIGHLDLPRYFIVDIAKNELRYVSNRRDSLALKVVVGKPATPTPYFAAWINQLVLYPYWYVPFSIATQEFLPKLKKDATWLDNQNMQVMDKGGRILNADTIQWKKYSSFNFPFTLRQSTGCDNALGILKFEFSTPYGVYIHDTNNKAAFLRKNRFISHGCIRVEEPFLLSELVLKEKLDTGYLQTCLMEQKPTYQKITDSVPVFSIYTIAHAQQNGTVTYLKDHYNLFK